MRIRLHEVRIIVLMFCFLAGICSQAKAARQITDHQLIEVGEAAAVSVQLEMRSGELKVEGEGNALLDAAFSYQLDSLRPEVEYKVDAEQGWLLVRQPAHKSQQLTIYDDYRWEMALSPHLPLDLMIKLNAGDAELSLGGMNLDSLSVELGAGNLLLDLTGNWKKSLIVWVKGGAGNLHLLLPKTAGVTVTAKCGMGTIELTRMNRDGNDHFSNNAYGRSEITLYIDVEIGAGVIHLEQESSMLNL